MGTSTCRWMRARLPLLAGDDLIGPDRRRAERHLIGCPDCRRHLAALRGAIEALRSAAEVPAVAPGAAAPLWPDLARQIRESRRPAPAFALPRLPWPAVALATTMLLTLGTVALWPRIRPTNRPEAHAVAAPRGPVVRTPLLTSQTDDDRDKAPSNAPSSRLGRPFDSEQAVLTPAEVQDTH